MIKHRFSAGDRVAVSPDRSNVNARPGIYTIVRIMPVTGPICQYRVKNALDAHERVLDEAQLTAV